MDIKISTTYTESAVLPIYYKIYFNNLVVITDINHIEKTIHIDTNIKKENE